MSTVYECTKYLVYENVIIDLKKSLVSYMKPWTEARNDKYMKYHSKLIYQLSFWNVSRKVDYQAGGKCFIHGPERLKENQLLSLKHPCWLSLV